MARTDGSDYHHRRVLIENIAVDFELSSNDNNAVNSNLTYWQGTLRRGYSTSCKTPVTVETTGKVTDRNSSGRNIDERTAVEEDVNQNVLNILDRHHPIYGVAEIVETDNNENCLWGTSFKLGNNNP
jgi:hypothetical protein